MFKTLQNALKMKELRGRLIFTFLMLLVIRFGSQLPVPGVDPDYFADFFNGSNGDAFNLFNAMTGGSFENFSILALSISPYITSSIIIQLLTIAIPKLEELQQDGQEGRKKIAEITRYVTVGLALIQSTAMSIGFGRSGMFEHYTWYNVVVCVITLTAGSAFLMWVGERITEKGDVYGMFFEHLLIEAGMCLQVSQGFSESGFLIQFNLFRRTKLYVWILFHIIGFY